jgi:lipopolysaccharide transport system permease protein
MSSESTLTLENEDVSDSTSTQNLNNKNEYSSYKDYFDGLKKYKMWLSLAFSEIKRRYRLTFFGPFWTTLSLAIFIISMGLLFSNLWKMEMKSYLPYFCSGYICWILISTILLESCHTFVNAESLMKQIPLPYSFYAWQLIARNALVFLHHSVIYLFILFIFHVPLTVYSLLFIPGLLLLFLSASWVSILFGLLCARFRDLQQVITSLLQISMFVTPIFWPETQLGQGMKSYIIINANPLYHYIAIIRQPLLGLEPHKISWIIVGLITIFGWFITMKILSKQYQKLIFWL